MVVGQSLGLWTLLLVIVPVVLVLVLLAHIAGVLSKDKRSKYNNSSGKITMVLQLLVLLSTTSR